jgi:mevalonate kinase
LGDRGGDGFLSFQVKASAPGKIILLGEHAVVYGRPALAVPIPQVRAEAEVTESARPGIWIQARDVGLDSELGSLPADHPLGALVRKLLAVLHRDVPPNLRIKIHSTIPVASGLGSGASVSVALIRALAGAMDLALSDEQVSTYAFEIEKLHHGTPSGIDNTVVTYAKPVYFVSGLPPETLEIGARMHFVIGDTGIPAPTRESVADVRRLRASDVARWESVFEEIGSLVLLARECIEGGALTHLGALMDRDQELLQLLNVSSPELECLIASAHRAGALGAKLSGGGRGGNMIALLAEDTVQTVSAALASAGARRVIAATLEKTTGSKEDSDPNPGASMAERPRQGMPSSGR